MSKIVLLVCIVATILLIACVSFYAVRLHKKENEDITKLSKYTVCLHERGYHENQYILHEVEALDSLSAMEIAKRTVAEMGYFGLLTIQKNYDRIMELLIIDSVEKE